MAGAERDFLIVPDRGRWFKVTAMCAEGAYSGLSSFFSQNCLIGVVDMDTMEISVFSSVLDHAGNLIRVVRHDKNSLEALMFG